MLSGLKFIPREEVRKDKLDDLEKESVKSTSRNKESSRFDTSDEEFERITEKSKRKKNWYSDDDDVSLSSHDSNNHTESKLSKKRKTDKKNAKTKYNDSSDDKERDAGEKLDKDIVRKEMGLDWMLRPKDDTQKNRKDYSDHWPEETPVKEDVSTPHPNMRIPRRRDSLSWGKEKSRRMSVEDAGLVSSTLASLNKFSNDGSFMSEVTRQHPADTGAKHERERKSDIIQLNSEELGGTVFKPDMSANQIAAKVMQLHMKGKHEEADNLLKEAEKVEAQSSDQENASRKQEGHMSRYVMHGTTVRQKKNKEDADMHLANNIMQNKKFSIAGRADDEYDYDEGPGKQSGKKGSNDHRSRVETNFAQLILTQQERCQFCFENPTRPRHLIVSIANFAYLMLPQWQPVVPGHCCILPMQHEACTRNVDSSVWDEIRNFKKCLIMMFAKQAKEVVFMETVMGLAQQRRHCLIECIPLPQAIAKQAPLYFKKAIDEAEDEWSQHNAKKLIDTSVKGLRGSIPKDFPYFHVEFGLSKGFVHVIDDETQFKRNFGLNVIRGILKLPAEDMHSRRKHESVDSQKQAVKSFIQEWEAFDWTKQLD